MVNDHLGPEAERRLVLKWFGLDEGIIKHLRDLDDAETEWRVLHEHSVFMGWLERRRDFLIAECMNGRVYTPVPQTDANIVQLRGNRAASVTGEKLG
jgi:hypothetical protein